MEIFCETCGEVMEKKLDVDDIQLHWCRTCGTCRLVAPDIEGFEDWWRPLRERLRPLRRTP